MFIYICNTKSSDVSNTHLLLGGVMEETEPAEWDDKASSVRESGWIPSGHECPWRFNSVMLFTSCVDELHTESSLNFRLRVQNDISLGLVTVKLPGDVLGTATADLTRHVLPICARVPAEDCFRWASSVQMVSLKGSDGSEVAQVAVSFAVDADPKEVLFAARATRPTRPLLRKPAPSSWWMDICTSATRRQLCSQECQECAEEPDAYVAPPLVRRLEPPSLAPPEQCSDGWISRKGPGGRIFWHHKALGPAPWETIPPSLKKNRAFVRSIMGKVADLGDTVVTSEALWACSGVPKPSTKQGKRAEFTKISTKILHAFSREAFNLALHECQLHGSQRLVSAVDVLHENLLRH